MSYSISSSGEVSRVDVTGVTTADELIEALSEVHGTAPIPNVLFTFELNSLSGFSANAFVDVVSFARQYHAGRGASPKTAILVETDVEHMLMTAFTDYAALSSPVAFRIFRKEDEALSWISIT